MVRVLALIINLFLASVVLADGTFAKLGALARPGIPYQRAIISYRDGIQTMVVESTLDGPPGDYVWIVPVPTPPKRVMEVTPEGMRYADRHLGPIVSRLDAGTDVLHWVGVWLALVAFAVAWRGFHPDRRRRDLTVAIGVAVAGAIGAALFTPVFASQSGSPKGVISVSAHRAGSYRVDVLRPDDGKALREWVEMRGGSLTAEAQATADAYVRDGWCFAVAQLKPHPGGQAVPHPLGLEFKSPRPIYPMRLTGTQTNDLLLELIVVADGMARVEPLRNWYARQSKWGVLTGTTADADQLQVMPLDAVTWSGSTTTRLRGVVSPAQMKRDFEIEVGAPPVQPYRIRILPAKAVAAFRSSVAIGVGSFAAFVLACALAMRGSSTGSRLLLCALGALSCGGAAYVLTCSSMERLEPDYYLAQS
ncbi:MAG: DUF2330 domain-containing protein [Fimbriimonas sp.]